MLKRLDEALLAHLCAAELATDDRSTIRAKATYNVACVHALQGRADDAMQWLEKAVRSASGTRA